jgi:hypothetical protein
MPRAARAAAACDVSGIETVEVTEAFLPSAPSGLSSTAVPCMDILGLGTGTAAAAAGDASFGVVGVVLVEEVVTAAVMGRSRTKSGVCLFLLCQKFLFELNPAPDVRCFPVSSTDVLFAHRFRFAEKLVADGSVVDVVESCDTWSLEPQLDCFSWTIALGATSGDDDCVCRGAMRGTLGLAPPDAVVGVAVAAAAALVLAVSRGRDAAVLSSVDVGLADAPFSTSPLEETDPFRFACSISWAKASTCAIVELSWF